MLIPLTIHLQFLACAIVDSPIAVKNIYKNISKKVHYISKLIIFKKISLFKPVDNLSKNYEKVNLINKKLKKKL